MIQLEKLSNSIQSNPTHSGADLSACGNTYSFLVFAQSGVDDTHVEEDLAGVTDLVKLLESIIELVVVVVTKGGNPGLDFLEAGGGG